MVNANKPLPQGDTLSHFPEVFVQSYPFQMTESSYSDCLHTVLSLTSPSLRVIPLPS